MRARASKSVHVLEKVKGREGKRREGKGGEGKEREKWNRKNRITHTKSELE